MDVQPFHHDDARRRKRASKPTKERRRFRRSDEAPVEPPVDPAPLHLGESVTAPIALERSCERTPTLIRETVRAASFSSGHAPGSKQSHPRSTPLHRLRTSQWSCGDTAVRTAADRSVLRDGPESAPRPRILPIARPNAVRRPSPHSDTQYASELALASQPDRSALPAYPSYACRRTSKRSSATSPSTAPQIVQAIRGRIRHARSGAGTDPPLSESAGLRQAGLTLNSIASVRQVRRASFEYGQ